MCLVMCFRNTAPTMAALSHTRLQVLGSGPGR